MKRLLILFFAFSLNFTFAQNDNLERDFKNYHQLISNKKVDLAMDYVNPKVFEFLSKEAMIQLLQAVFNVPNIEYRMSPPSIVEMDNKAKKIDNIDYISLKALTPLEVKFKDIKIDEDNLPIVMQNLEQKFGAGNVSYDKETDFFKVNSYKKAIASSDDGQNWKFVIIENPKMKTFLAKILPAEVLE